MNFIIFSIIVLITLIISIFAFTQIIGIILFKLPKGKTMYLFGLLVWAIILIIYYLCIKQWFDNYFDVYFIASIIGLIICIFRIKDLEVEDGENTYSTNTVDKQNDMNNKIKNNKTQTNYNIPYWVIITISILLIGVIILGGLLYYNVREYNNYKDYKEKYNQVDKLCKGEDFILTNISNKLYNSYYDGKSATIICH